MTATQTRPSTRKPRRATARRVKELLLEIAYHLHATKPVKRLPA